MTVQTKDLHEGPEKITQEEFAHLLYTSAVIHDAWATEQDGYKQSFRNEAQRLITRLSNAGFDIVKRQKR